MVGRQGCPTPFAQTQAMSKIDITPSCNSCGHKKYAKIFFIILITFLALLIFIPIITVSLVRNNHKQYSDGFHQTKQTIIVQETKLQVFVASADDEVVQGLSGREQLLDNQGMLFLFPDTDYRTFWMKDMLFDIDMIFIRGNTIVDIAKNMPAPSGLAWPATYTSKSTADKVLEVNAGLADRHNWNIGDGVSY
jgi:uncharacterized membrane protein (UPF0127 family)